MSQNLFSSKYNFRQFKVTIQGFKCWPIVLDDRVIGYLRCDVKKMSKKTAQAKQSEYWHLLDGDIAESVQEFLVDKDKIILGDSIWKPDGSLFNCYFELIEEWIDPNGDNYAVFVHLLPNLQI